MKALTALVFAGAALIWAGAELRARGVFFPGAQVPAQRVAAPPPGAIPPDRPARLLLIGTSLTARGDWPDLLAARLSACRPAGVEAIRLARPGAGSAWGAQAIGPALARLQAEGRAPDIAVVEFAINDASLARGTRLARSMADHEAILDALAAAPGPPAIGLSTMNPAWGRDGWERPGFAAYAAQVRALAAMRGAVLIDTVPAWRALPASRRRALVPDGLHPTPEGMAEILAPRMETALRPLLCP